MGRYHFDNKKTVEESTELSIFRLNNWGLLKDWHSTTLTWTRKYALGGKCEQSAGLIIDITCERPYAKLNYTITRYRDGSTEKYDYKIYLAKTSCHLSGFRYWFLCPRCGRRSGKLYRKPLGEMYLCRICNDLTYESRNETRYGGFGRIGYMLRTSKQIEDLYGEIKRWTWRDRPTRKVRKLQALEQKMRVLSGPVMEGIERFTAGIRK